MNNKASIFSKAFWVWITISFYIWIRVLPSQVRAVLLRGPFSCYQIRSSWGKFLNWPLQKETLPSSTPLSFFTTPPLAFVPNLELICAHNQLSRKLKQQEHFLLIVCCLLWWWPVRMDIKQSTASVGASCTWHLLCGCASIINLYPALPSITEWISCRRNSLSLQKM